MPSTDNKGPLTMNSALKILAFAAATATLFAAGIALAERPAADDIAKRTAAPADVFALPAEPIELPSAAATRLDIEPETLPLHPGAAPTRAAAGATTKAARALANTATIRGSVFYNDRRTDGLFEARRDKMVSPDSVAACPASAIRQAPRAA